MNQLVKGGDEQFEHCYKCCIQLTPDLNTADGHCPRCGYDLKVIDISESVATVEQLRRKQADKEKYDLMQMVGNWAAAERRWINECGVDWSAPHELVQRIGDMMLPWIGRLVQAGYFEPKDVAEISAVVDHEIIKTIELLENNEEKLRLEGEWNEKEQEIKEYWGERLGKFRQLSMRNTAKRIIDDR